MPDVELRHFVVGQVVGLDPAALELGEQLLGLAPVRDLDPDEDMRDPRIGIAVVEFGDLRACPAAGRTCGSCRAARGSSPRASPRAARPARRARRRSAAGRNSCWRRRRWRRTCGPSSGAARPTPSRRRSASAPAGSRIERVSSKTSFIAAQMASVSTRTISSTYCRTRRNVSLPTCFTATPSANRPTCASLTRRPAASERAIASESSGCTPITLISGRTRFTYAAMPLDRARRRRWRRISRRAAPGAGAGSPCRSCPARR